MNAISVKGKMLYCPKCQRKYEDGSQRFCNSDGGRLLSVVESKGKHADRQKGVFTSLLGRVPSRFDKDEQLDHTRTVSYRVATPDIPKRDEGKEIKTETVFLPELKPDKTTPAKPNDTSGDVLKRANGTTGSTKSDSPTRIKPEVATEHMEKSPGRVVEPGEISNGSAPLGARTTDTTRRPAFSTGTPDVLVGQVVKGRYLISKKIDADEGSAAYAAEDRIIKGKNVVVRVLKNVSEHATFLDKIFAEERVSLSHINHPNVAKVIDSGELPEGSPFIVTEEARDKSAAMLLATSAGSNHPMRVARIVRQAAYALSEVHQNGILHRNLRPEHILLTISEAGTEQVVVTDFCVGDGGIVEDNFEYRAPEQIGGQLPTFASDSYALAVIAYRLLTKRLPFEGGSARVVLAAQKSENFAKPSDLNENLSEKVDSVFTKALAFDPSKRFSKAREFGEALFSTLSDEYADLEAEIQGIAARIPAVGETEFSDVESEERTYGKDPDLSSTAVNSAGLDSDIRIESINTGNLRHDTVEPFEDELAGSGFAGSNESRWKNRSTEVVRETGLMWPLVPALGGLLFLAAAVVGIWWYFVNLPQEIIETEVPVQSNSSAQEQGVDSVKNPDKSFAADIETPPPVRQVAAPPNSVFFENSSLNLNEELTKNFLKFSLYYPEKWQRKLFDKEQKKVDDKFLDIAISSKDGIPIKHFTVGPYESTGTFKTDTELFVKLVEKSNRDTSESLRPGSFEVVSQGATTIQNGRWKAYQVNFESKGKLPDGRQLSIWGRRLWIPVQRPGEKAGFIITMLATSLADDVKSADDVGKKGDLARILQTFEPAQEF